MNEPWDDRGTEVRNSRLPRGFVGMLGLLLAIELFVSHASLDLARPEYWLWYATGRSARLDAKQAEILCLGTSQTSYGVVPQVLEEQLGRRTYNLAMCSSPPQADYYLLKRALDSGARPKALVLDLHPHLMKNNYWGCIRFFPNLLSARESIDLGWTARDPDFTAEVLLAKAFPSILNRFDIRNAVMATLDGKACSLRKPTLTSLWNRVNNQGAMILAPKNSPPTELTPTDHEWFAPSAWSYQQINTLYVRRLLKLAAAHDITVFLLVPPLDARLQQLRQDKGLSASFEEFAKGLQAHHPNLVVVDGAHSGYPSSAFADAMHVSRPGAISLTCGLGEILRPYLEGGPRPASRWFVLPPYRERTSRAEITELAEVKETSLPWKIRR
ncbi:Protein of unknown function [Singulisphaera sp. GP187]|uniref:DUF1574 family protein n=1 Tax=Singulisphaera sp. GP187 TaxID=1882752 RepID=UPI00092A7497|nr:DUF1574 family protein [Singulisphaera sp. GP187]SIO60088.1 Protein of unknown function [Singulisphaera sp. GP187]